MKDSTDASSKTLKGRNLAWLVATLVLDVLVLLVLVFNTAIQEMTLPAIAAVRTSLTALLPVPALLLASLISADHKAILVFWRIKNPLPGSRAFSVHAPADYRIDLAKLKKHIGEFPTDPREQNAKWYGLYKQVASDLSVQDGHKNYLLFRDIAAMSLLLVPALPIAMHFMDVRVQGILTSAALFAGQYFLATLAARTAGIRFVQNVLAVHASRKVAGSGTTASKT